MNSTHGSTGISAALWSEETWAAEWNCSARKVHQLRKHPQFPVDATVVLGPRAVRFRVERLAHFAAILAQETPPSEPRQLLAGKAAKAQRVARADEQTSS